MAGGGWGWGAPASSAGLPTAEAAASPMEPRMAADALTRRRRRPVDDFRCNALACASSGSASSANTVSSPSPPAAAPAASSTRKELRARPTAPGPERGGLRPTPCPPRRTSEEENVLATGALLVASAEVRPPTSKERCDELCCDRFEPLRDSLLVCERMLDLETSRAAERDVCGFSCVGAEPSAELKGLITSASPSSPAPAGVAPADPCRSPTGPPLRSLEFDTKLPLLAPRRSDRERDPLRVGASPPPSRREPKLRMLCATPPTIPLPPVPD